MTYPRKLLVNPETTPYYHVYTQCVRRAFLCGWDNFSKKDYSYRKEYIVERLSTLSEVFAIKLAGYAIMSNHYHLVIYLDTAAAKKWSRAEVMERWSKIASLPSLLGEHLNALNNDAKEKSSAIQWIEERRQRLCNLSWYMRFLNEYIARRANREDNCKGRFFENRFKSQALLDEQAILTCMSYVDLNPVRARITNSVKTSDWTSIQQRIQESYSCEPTRIKNNNPHNIGPKKTLKPRLLPFLGNRNHKLTLPFTYISYLTLIDWSSRQIKKGKKGIVDESIPTILSSTKINFQHWMDHMHINGNGFVHAIGHPECMRNFASQLQRKWIHGISAAERLFLKNTIAAA